MTYSPGRPPASGWTLGADEVHVWAFTLVPPHSGLERLSSVLSPVERQRAERFRFDSDRTRFVVGRGQIRHILSRYVQMEPADLEFVYGTKGKPSLPVGQDCGNGLQFNLSHSEDLALLAVAHGRQIGVDVERIRPVDDAEELVARFFSQREVEKFARLAATERPLAFFNLWTRKEAWLKAVGEGIGEALNKVEVSFLPGEPPALLRLAGVEHHVEDWSLTHLEPALGFTAAVAFYGRVATVVCWEWPTD